MSWLVVAVLFSLS